MGDPNPGTNRPAHWLRKLTPEQVREIRALCKLRRKLKWLIFTELTYKAIGKRYGLSPQNVHQVDHRTTYAEIDPMDYDETLDDPEPRVFPYG